MPTARTKTERLMEETIQAHADDAERVLVLERAKRFKRTWIELAEVLVKVREGETWHRWGFRSFDDYCARELRLKRGTVDKLCASYGFLRVMLPIFPDATQDLDIVVLLIALASILYGSVLAFTQTNTRLILGYSSMAQLGFITLGIFALGQATGAQGGLLQMVNHGLVVAPLFFIVALLSERTGGSEDLRDMGGIAFRAPVLAGLFLIVALATLAMPGSANFVGEFLILLGVFNAKLAIALIASTGVVLASVYVLRMYIRSMHNRVAENVTSYEISARDGLVLVPLVLCILAFALYPQQALEHSEPSVKRAIAAAGANSSAVAERGVTP